MYRLAGGLAIQTHVVPPRRRHQPPPSPPRPRREEGGRGSQRQRLAAIPEVGPSREGLLRPEGLQHGRVQLRAVLVARQPRWHHVPPPAQVLQQRQLVLSQHVCTLRCAAAASWSTALQPIFSTKSPPSLPPNTLVSAPRAASPAPAAASRPALQLQSDHAAAATRHSTLPKAHTEVGQQGKAAGPCSCPPPSPTPPHPPHQALDPPQGSPEVGQHGKAGGPVLAVARDVVEPAAPAGCPHVQVAPVAVKNVHQALDLQWQGDKGRE